MFFVFLFSPLQSLRKHQNHIEQGWQTFHIEGGRGQEFALKVPESALKSLTVQLPPSASLQRVCLASFRVSLLNPRGCGLVIQTALRAFDLEQFSNDYMLKLKQLRHSLVIGLKISRQFFNQWKQNHNQYILYARFFPPFEQVTSNCQDF